jgi:hypothetical protein
MAGYVRDRGGGLWQVWRVHNFSAHHGADRLSPVVDRDSPHLRCRSSWRSCAFRPDRRAWTASPTPRPVPVSGTVGVCKKGSVRFPHFSDVEPILLTEGLHEHVVGFIWLDGRSRMRTPAGQLATLPEAIQVELWDIVRAAAGLSQEERVDVMAALTGTAEAMIIHRPMTRVGVTALINAVGQVVTQVDHAAFPRTEEVV